MSLPLEYPAGSPFPPPPVGATVSLQDFQPQGFGPRPISKLWPRRGNEVNRSPAISRMPSICFAI